MDCKLDVTGGIQWQKALGGTSNETANSVIQTSDGNYVIAGFTSSSDGDLVGDHSSGDVWVVKLTETGEIIWLKTFGGSAIEGAVEILATDDCGYAFTGFTGSNDGDVTGLHGTNDQWTVKLYPDIVGISTLHNDIFSVFPNPVHEKLIIKLGRPVQHARILLTNTLGQVALDQPITGVTASLDIGHLTRGGYMLSLFDENLFVTQMVVLE